MAYLLTGMLAAAAAPTASPTRVASVPACHHRIVYHVSSNDQPMMQRALGTADNAFKHYRSRGETARIEIVANGGGVHMMRSDTTPVGPMLQYMRSTYPDLVLTACGITRTIMETNEARTVPLLEGVGVVTAGIVRAVELQEEGYAYVKP
ncbi:DsrE family protein [Methylobacterium sp. 275MFSha3.1]|uniref:DsrE family protein n=1 Tax=Methylobacterium sp. 275MFSha3.1 TaxID=1502746 RepID=UPI001115365C|nr:DsrE family protein [Methylobacterium sp. 275MFSha3.1]